MTTAKKLYANEREGQIKFFENYGIPYDTDPTVLTNNTDGVYNGVIMEFKLNISDLNATLFQVVKYLSAFRVKGIDVPATILLIDLNGQKAYKYNSEDYRAAINKTYVGSASVNNSGFTSKCPVETIDYSEMVGSAKLKKILKNTKTITQKYMPVDIDEENIVGLGTRYYAEVPGATKGDFLGDKGEIRKPVYFKGLIVPYTGKDNEKFKEIMDKLNDKAHQKDLGAFYTPAPYCELTVQLVVDAANRAIDGGKKDYIILDRCAGTGNLEEKLIGVYDKNNDELISHVVCSTYEYYEYKVLKTRIGDKVRDLIPPTEADIVYANGLISNSNAMDEDYINNPILRAYVDDPDVAIIGYENVPYHDETSNTKSGTKTKKTEDYITTKMKEIVGGKETNELANRFAWSMQKYYMRGEFDAYVIYSPIKYWKNYKFFNMKFEEGCALNREHFHASESCVVAALWVNEKPTNNDIKVSCYNIVDNNIVKENDDLIITRVDIPASAGYSKMKFLKSDKTDKLFCETNGCIRNGKTHAKSYYTNEIIGYMVSCAFPFAPLNKGLTRFTIYNGHGCYLTKDNYKELLPLWCAKNYKPDYWYQKDVYATTYDGNGSYKTDVEFLKKCLIFTGLTNQNKILSMKVDGKTYLDELCFDHNTIASKELRKMRKDKNPLNKDEEDLMKLWFKILKEAKQCANYNPDYKYSPYQIREELNTFKKVLNSTGNKEVKVYDYPELNGDLKSLQSKVTAYYKKYIEPKMFEYELIK